MLRISIEEASSAHFAYSIETITTIDALKKALIQRYAPLFFLVSGENNSYRAAVPLLSF